MKQEDRVRQTKQAFRTALLHYLQKKTIDKITVKDLTDFTNYSRSTFYLYYQDIFALKEDLEQAVFSEVQARMERHSPEELKKTLTPLIREMYEYADQNRDVFFILSSNNSYLELTGGIMERLRDYCYSSWDILYPNADRNKYHLYYHYLASGLISTVIYWITDGQESIDEISAVTAQLAEAGAKVLYSK